MRLSVQLLQCAMLYVVFCLQASLRPEFIWHGYAPNFLVMFLVMALWKSSHNWGLVLMAVLGFLSDCLAPGFLGADMVCYLSLGVVLQLLCPPRLIRHPPLMLVLIAVVTLLIEFSSISMRGMLGGDQDMTTQPIQFSFVSGLTSFGDALYTTLLAVPFVLLLNVFQGERSENSDHPSFNNWHRLTSKH